MWNQVSVDNGGNTVQAGNEITLTPVGLIRTSAADDEVRQALEGLEATVEIFPEFREALDGLEGYSHIFVLSYLHRLRPDQVGPLKVKPRGLLKRGFKLEELPLVGVFSIDSPTRPNPIGLSLVRLLRIEGTRLFVSGLDLFDGTPVIDIKPYRSDRSTQDFKMPEWYTKLFAKVGKDF
jgi:tRNA-Thr(GGU) m(6)t(6)A37 methyltransferase TsaA